MFTNLVNKITKFIYKQEYRSDEGLKHLIASGVVVEKFNGSGA